MRTLLRDEEKSCRVHAWAVVHDHMENVLPFPQLHVSVRKDGRKKENSRILTETPKKAQEQKQDELSLSGNEPFEMTSSDKDNNDYEGIEDVEESAVEENISVGAEFVGKSWTSLEAELVIMGQFLVKFLAASRKRPKQLFFTDEHQTIFQLYDIIFRLQLPSGCGTTKRTILKSAFEIRHWLNFF